MRTLLAVATAAILLSGCSSSSGLTTYIMQPNDAIGCELVPMSDEELQGAKQEAGLTGNPGSIDNEQYTIGNVTPVDNLVSIYECDDNMAFAQAIQFASTSDLDAWLESIGACEHPGNGMLQDGTILAIANAPPPAQTAWENRVLNQTAAGPAC